jgi:predicted RND superfamily exporter protein
MRERLLKKWARFAATHPWRVIIGLLVVAVFAAISASRITMEMRWSDLLPMNDPKAREFDEILTEYKSASTFLVVVRGEEQQIKQFADVIAPQILELTQYFDRVDYKIDKEFFSEHGFMLTEASDLENTADLFKDLNLIPLLTSINDNFEEEYVGDEEALSTKEKENEAVRTLDGFYSWLKAMDEFITDPNAANATLADSAVERLLYGDPYFISQDKRVLLMNCKANFTSMDIDKDIASTDSVQVILDRNLPDFPGVKAGIAGMIPLQKDEMEHTTKDMQFSSILALVLVLGLFILTFRMWSAAILAGLNLMLSILIAAGVVGLLLGRLNLMTSMFAVVLIGLGIDYSIHIISVYGERRAINKDAVSARHQGNGHCPRHRHYLCHADNHGRPSCNTCGTRAGPEANQQETFQTSTHRIQDSQQPRPQHNSPALTLSRYRDHHNRTSSIPGAEHKIRLQHAQCRAQGVSHRRTAGYDHRSV